MVKLIDPTSTHAPKSICTHQARSGPLGLLFGHFRPKIFKRVHMCASACKNTPSAPSAPHNPIPFERTNSDLHPTPESRDIPKNNSGSNGVFPGFWMRESTVLFRGVFLNAGIYCTFFRPKCGKKIWIFPENFPFSAIHWMAGKADWIIKNGELRSFEVNRIILMEILTPNLLPPLATFFKNGVLGRKTCFER